METPILGLHAAGKKTSKVIGHRLLQKMKIEQNSIDTFFMSTELSIKRFLMQMSLKQTGVAKMNKSKLNLPTHKIAEFCKKNNIIKLSLFGSVLRDDFQMDSDIDFLVEFETGKVPGLISFSRMERELSEILGNRKVDLRTPQELSKYFRDEVMAQAEVQYAAA